MAAPQRSGDLPARPAQRVRHDHRPLALGESRDRGVYLPPGLGVARALLGPGLRPIGERQLTRAATRSVAALEEGLEQTRRLSAVAAGDLPSLPPADHRRPSLDLANVAEVAKAAIRSIPKEKGQSQEALGLESGLDRTYVGGVERGERNPTFGSLLRIAEVLGVRLSTLPALSERIR